MGLSTCLLVGLSAHHICAALSGERRVRLLHLHLPQTTVGYLRGVDRGWLARLLRHVRRAEPRIEVGIEYRELGVSIGHCSAEPRRLRRGGRAALDVRADDHAKPVVDGLEAMILPGAG
jgi:hypothetical protein